MQMIRGAAGSPPQMCSQTWIQIKDLEPWLDNFLEIKDYAGALPYYYHIDHMLLEQPRSMNGHHMLLLVYHEVFVERPAEMEEQDRTLRPTEKYATVRVEQSAGA